jgi:hypothetical protein
MPAYLLIQARLTDPVRFRDYAQRAAALVARFGGRYRVLGGQPLQLEGAESDLRTVIPNGPTGLPPCVLELAGYARSRPCASAPAHSTSSCSMAEAA